MPASSTTTTWLPAWAWGSMELLQSTDHMILMRVSDELLTVCKPSTLSQDLVAHYYSSYELHQCWYAINRIRWITEHLTGLLQVLYLVSHSPQSQALVLDLTTHGGLRVWGPQCPSGCPALPITSWRVCYILPLDSDSILSCLHKPPSLPGELQMALHDDFTLSGFSRKKEPIGWIYICVYVCVCVRRKKMGQEGCHMARRILVSWPGFKSRPWQWKCWILTTGPPGNFKKIFNKDWLRHFCKT